ncbi:hypothetical protein BME96_12415 [Virgibacillus halodenitrificans]|uniref:Uncharacterized protein n=1 Tax=Virgibacillus halodenitrificans TaxID=1482 RepID=A0AAC9J0N4_VIRHA|nr:hypothetical protein [Virgibacillus halodenitrificans]APC48947.1 hypothetical protein BME96_12415 [Virgibacillus halodenitrificans]
MIAFYGRGLYMIRQDKERFEVRIGYDIIKTIRPKSKEEYEEIQALLQNNEDLSNWKDDEGNNIIPDANLLYFFEDM